MSNVVDMKKVFDKKIGGLIIAAVVIGVVIILALLCVKQVPTGYTGIVTTFGKVEQNTLEAGIHVISPVQKVILMDNRTQKVSRNDTAFSSDIQQVDIAYSVNYNIDKSTAMNLYKEVGVNYFDVVILPRLAENLKAVFSKYTADSLVKQRETLSVQIGDALSKEMEEYGINIINVNVEDIDFTEAFTQAVEQKQVAEQTKLKAETEQAQKTMEAEEQAKRQLIEAEAEAEVAKIQAEAAQYAGEREAEKNRKLAESITPELVEYYYIEKWNGELPTYVGGGGTTIPILNMGENSESEVTD